MSKKLKIKKFDSINGLRVIACLGIVLMHVLTNGNYAISGVSNLIINHFTNFVFLFFMISSFGMCCGYFDKIKSNEIDIEKFYSKRINKILPFFTFMIIIDIIIKRSMESVVEGFADFTLIFGFLQKNISVIGVGWFIGLIFIFYIMFPYFTYLFSNKKRAWITTIVALLMSLSCIYYFNIGRTNMFYSFIYFCIGGLVFLYKDSIIKKLKKSRIIGILFLLISIAVYFIEPMNNEYFLLLKTIIIFTVLLCYSISYNSTRLSNRITLFISNISFEIYLSHMLIFRIVEKAGFVKIFNNDSLSFIFVFILVSLGSILLAIVFKNVYFVIKKKVCKNENIVS